MRSVVAAERRSAPSQTTRSRIIAATVETLRAEGFAATSARSIARHGDFNQALIFYHFGSLTGLFVAALEEVAAGRLADYRVAVRRANTLSTAIDVARRQYERDVAEGHITVLAELSAGASSIPELGPELVRCMQPWIDFAEQTIAGLISGTPLSRLVPPHDAAVAVVALYLGMELLDHLDPDTKTSANLFAVAKRLAATLEPLLAFKPSRASKARGRRPRRIVISGPREEPKR